MEDLNPSTQVAEDVVGQVDEEPHNIDARVGAVALKTEASVDNDPDAYLKARANSFLRRHGQEFGIFSRRSKLRFVPALNDTTFSFDAENLTVNAPIGWFASERYNDDELSFANHHEIAHFLDMQKNPDAFLKNFEYMEQRAESLAKDYLVKHLDKVPFDAVKKKYWKAIHELYNVLDDIYVNNLVFQKNKFFGSGDGRDDVESLYEKVGFEKADLTDMPLHKQMIYALLRDEMLGETHGKSIVDERVEKILSKALLGSPSMRAFIDTHLKPRQGIEVDPDKRYMYIRRLIEPKFLELLEIDSEEQVKREEQMDEQGEQGEEDEQNKGGGEEEQEKNSEGKGKERSSEGREFDPFGDKRGRQIARDILDHGEEGDQVIKDILDRLNKSDEELAKERLKKWDEAHNISEEQRLEIERIKKKNGKAQRKMRKFWKKLIGKSIEYRQTIIHGQRRGRFNASSLIKSFADYEEAKRNGNLRSLEIYDRVGIERKVVDQPEEIAITLLVDCSGSMSGSKIEAAKETAALLMYSIKDFNRDLESNDVQTATEGTKLRAKTEVVVFGSAFETVKKFEKTRLGNDRDSAAIVQSISRINSNLGSTNDAAPLGAILASLTSEERKRIKQGKLKKIVFEITDGEPDNSELTSEQLDALSDIGILVIGFQIGNVDNGEKQTFETIWNNGKKSSNKHGVFVGQEIDKLPESLMGALANSLSNIMI